MPAPVTLINLEGGESFSFQYFPAIITTTDRANWEPQETTIGVKPLFYANREPRQIEFPELYFDKTDTNDTVKPDCEALKNLMVETGQGTPPALLCAWGDQLERCVLTEARIDYIFFHAEGYPMRARISMTLTQLQAEGEATSVQILN